MMLSPTDRTLLFEALRPPPGFSLRRAVGTTYTLDLLALLTTPLAFSFFSWDENDDGMPADPLVLLNAVRENADRITVFCQAGRIGIPGKHRVLFQTLEDSVVEVMPPRPGGVFHPKVWLLRFSNAADEVRYRLLVLSRNLTFDRSWDVVLSLDGKLTGRANAFAVNQPLGDFVQALPGLATRPVRDEVREAVDRMQEEVRRVEFELPPGVESYRFWPLGLREGSEGSPEEAVPEVWPFGESPRRLLVISPFVSSSTLTRLTSDGKGHQLITRLEEVDPLGPAAFERFESVFRLSPDADLEEEDVDRDLDDSRIKDVPPSGLHAKVYVSDEGWDARLWMGSANATAAAFRSNVEFLAELRGKKSKIGIDKIMGDPDDELGLRALLERLEPPEEAVEEDALEAQLEERLRDARMRIAGHPMQVHVGEHADEGGYRLELRRSSGDLAGLDPEIAVRCWPITLQEEAAAVPLNPRHPVVADFGSRSMDAITPFIAFDLRVDDEGAEAHSRFVLNLPLEGAPADRGERMLEAVLKDRSEVLRFLLLLLQAEGLEEEGVLAAGTGFGLGEFEVSEWGEIPLLESLLKVLDRNPRKLDEVESFLEDLRSTERGRDLIPDGLQKVWDPIVKARRELAS